MINTAPRGTANLDHGWNCRVSSRRAVVVGAASPPAAGAQASAKSGVANSTGGEDPPRLRTLDELPTENGLPLLGVALNVIKPEYDLEEIFERHGDDAVNLNLGVAGGRVLALQTAEDMQECSITKAKDMFTKWPDAVEDLVMPLGRSTTNEETKPWRRALGKVLSQGIILKLQLPLIVEEFSETIQKYAESGEEVQWWYVSKRLTFSAAMRAALGDELSRQDMDELFPIATELGQGVFSPNFGLPFTSYWRAKKAQQKFIDVLSARINSIISDRQRLEGKDSMVKNVLEALEEEGVDTSTSAGKDVAMRLTREVLFLSFAGTDTTAYVISKTMTYLASHPEWMTPLAEEQTRLIAEYGEELDRKGDHFFTAEEEVKQKTPKSTIKCSTENSTFTVFSRSAVALAVAQETLRIKPPVKILFRRTTADITVGNVEVPSNTDIAMCARKAIRETGNGNPEFDPEQWLSEDRTHCTVNSEMGNFVFGKGARNCVGQNLAIIELVTVLAILGRQVATVDMAQEEQDREFFIIGDHPTGLPLRLIAH